MVKELEATAEIENTLPGACVNDLPHALLHVDAAIESLDNLDLEQVRHDLGILKRIIIRQIVGLA